MDDRIFVIVGASLAGGSAAAQLREDGFEGRIVLIGEEPAPPYERPELSKGYLRGTTERAKLDVRPQGFWAEQRVELMSSRRVTAVDPGSHEVTLDDERRLRYDGLLLATGSAPRRLEVPGADLAGIHYLRTLADSEAIREAASKGHRAVVVGGGWIGAEVAASLREMGLEVVLVLLETAPLERVMGPEVAAVYGRLHAEHGVKLLGRQRAVAFRGKRAVETVDLSDGSSVGGDLVVAGIGAVPRTELAAAAGLEIGNGIHVDANLRTSAPDIYAAGDVAAAWHPLFEERIRVEHWDNARKQGRAAARNMLGLAEPYDRVPFFYSDQYDLGMEYTGFAPEWDRVVFRGDLAKREFFAFWLHSGRVVAGMNANIWHIKDKIEALVRWGRPVSVERLADPSVALDDLASLEDRSGAPASS